MNEGFHLFVVHGLVLVLQGVNVADGLGIVAKSEDTAYTGSDKMLYCDYREGPPSEAISTVAVDWDKADSSQDYGWQNLCKGGTGNGISKFSRDPQKFFINPDGTDQSLTIRQITKEDAGIYRCMVVITTNVGQENSANATISLRVLDPGEDPTGSTDVEDNNSAFMLPSLAIILIHLLVSAFLLS